LDDLDTLLTERTKLVALTHQSNVLGTINPVREMVRLAHAQGAAVLIDGAKLSAFPCPPPVATLTLVVVPVRRSRTNTSSTPLVSPGTRFGAIERNATYRPFALSRG